MPKLPERMQALGGGHALFGVAAFLLLSVTAMAGISLFAHIAARQNASALVYESAGTELEGILRGLNEMALTERAETSLRVLKAELSELRALRRESAELNAQTGGAWPELDRRINVLTRNRSNVAFSEAELIELGGITTGIEGIQRELEQYTDAKRLRAVTAEGRIQMAIVAAGVVMILGTMGFFMFIVRDVTTRRVLDSVRASESQLRDITNAVPVMICYVDADRRFRFHNKATEAGLGLTHGQIRGRTFREVFGDEFYETLSGKVDQVLSGIPVHFESVRKDALGELHDYAVRYFPRYRGDREDQPVVGFYCTLTDITDMKRIDRMKTEFVSTVSHELRTPLTSIRGSLGLLSGGIAGALPDAARKLVDIAKSNCERLIRLINDILDSEKIESGEMQLKLEVIDVQVLVKQTLAANEGFAGQHQVSLALRSTEGAMFANVDTDRLVQVLTNLLSNAVKFSPAHGTAEVILSRAAGCVRVEVRDFGPGIPKRFHSRIFQKFSQADSSDTREKGGTGLGLSITKAIVERLGGTIGFASEAGAGTRFFFELPEYRHTPAPSLGAPLAQAA